jgi:hypothetical protein
MSSDEDKKYILILGWGRNFKKAIRQGKILFKLFSYFFILKD